MKFAELSLCSSAHSDSLATVPCAALLYPHRQRRAQWRCKFKSSYSIDSATSRHLKLLLLNWYAQVGVAICGPSGLLEKSG